MVFLWQYDLRSHEETARPTDLARVPPFNLVYSETGGEAESDPENADAVRFLKGPGVAPISLEKSDRVFAAFHGSGFFRYAKVGRELSFFGRNGEELWRKPYTAYPVSDVHGKLVMMLTGDNNRVDVIDASGNPAGVGSVAGNFMTDLDFAARKSAAAIVFSTGAVTVLNEQAKVVLRYNHESDDQPMFVKSCALGPNATTVAVHMLAGEKDRIAVLGFDPNDDNPNEYKVLRTIQLDQAYPHLLHFAVSRHGLLLAAPDRTAYYALESGADQIIEEARAATGETFRPVFSDENFFVYGDQDVAVVLDQSGRRLTGLVIGSSGPFRILPGPASRQFAIHSPERVELYEFAPP